MSTPTTNNISSSSSSTASSTSGTAPQSSITMEEEVSMYLKISDFYDLLGISKQATDEQIKKAYKKLALKFHPDKNGTVGSKDVFKKIAQACDCLLNPEKRAAYDRYGTEEPEQHYHNYRQQYNEDISPESIFDILFGKNNPFFTDFDNSTNNPNFPMNPNQNNPANPQQPNNQKRQKTDRLLSLLQLLPMFLIFFGSFFSNLFKQGPLYSRDLSGSLNMPRETALLHVQYYVCDAFLEKAREEPDWLQGIEHQLELEVVTQLRDDCTNNSQIQTTLLQQLNEATEPREKQYFKSKLAKISVISCNELERFRHAYNVDIDSVFT